MTRTDVAVIGGGIVGLAIARELGRRFSGMRVTVFEKETEFGRHQSGNNSGVVHAGVYYTPGSLKASLCRRGAGLLREYCADRDIAYAELGKLVVATSVSELPALDRIQSRAELSGVPALRRLGKNEIADVEPHVAGLSALHSPTTASVNYADVCQALAQDIVSQGGEVRLRSQVHTIERNAAGVTVVASSTPRRFNQAVVCAGLHGDRFAGQVSGSADMRVIPFRGEYYELLGSARDQIRGMVYPVPDSRYPFLGVHLTRDVRGRVHVGPNAVLALSLEGYRWWQISGRDVVHIATWPGMWHLARDNWRSGADEFLASAFKHRYFRKVQTYLPNLALDDMVRAGPASARRRSAARGRWSMTSPLRAAET